MIVEVDIDYEEVDKLVVSTLNDMLEVLEHDFDCRKSETGMAIFERDKDKDLKQLKKHIKAFKTVLKYYTGEDL